MLAFISGIFRAPRLFGPRPHHALSPTAPTAAMSAAAPRDGPLGIVITGGTKGVGRALAARFLALNDTVVICSRDNGHVQSAVLSLRAEHPNAKLYGFVADVADFDDVRRLLTFAHETMGAVDGLICNAGTVGGERGSLLAQDAADLKAVVDTNLLGSLYCCKEALRVGGTMQSTPLHVFLMDGSGTSGNATPEYAAYGATKRAIPQLLASLNKQAARQSSGAPNVRFHRLSPGMVLTDLLLKGNPPVKFKRIFNMLAEEPDTVANDLTGRIRTVIQRDQRNRFVAFLTAPKAVYRLLTGFLFGFRKNLFFDEKDGRRVDTTARYNENGVRIN